MKRNIAIVGSILLVLSVLVFFTGCDMPGGVMLDNEQHLLYSEFIIELAQGAQETEIPAEMVKEGLKESNKRFELYKFEIKDNNAGQKIVKNATVKELKKRFVPVKTK